MYVYKPIHMYVFVSMCVYGCLCPCVFVRV